MWFPGLRSWRLVDSVGEIATWFLRNIDMSVSKYTASHTETPHNVASHRRESFRAHC